MASKLVLNKLFQELIVGLAEQEREDSENYNSLLLFVGAPLIRVSKLNPVIEENLVFVNHFMEVDLLLVLHVDHQGSDHHYFFAPDFTLW